MPTNQFLATRVESEAHSSEIFSIAITPAQAITASGESSIKVWDARNPEHPLIHAFENAHPLGAHHVAVDLDNGGNVAASSGFGQELIVWDLIEGREKMRLKPNVFHGDVMVDGAEGRKGDITGEAWALAFSADGNILHTTTYDGRVVLWDTSSLKKITEIETKGSFGTSVTCSGDKRYIASGHQNGAINVFSTETNRLIYTLPGHSETVRSLSFSPGSNYLAATGDSRVISIYDIHHGEQIANLYGHTSSVLSIDWNRTGQFLLSSAIDGRVKVWDFEQKECVATQTESTSPIWSAKWSRTSDGFVIGGADKSLYWYIAAGV